MDENKILEAITALSTSVTALGNKTSNPLINTVIGALVVAFIMGGVVFWKTTEDNAIKFTEEIETIKEHNNHNVKVIAKALHVDLIYHIK
jgi:capsular polysaccharide biosynthesis protein